MTRSHRTFAASVVVALAGLLAGGRALLGSRPDERNHEVLNDMVSSVPYDAQARSPVFPDGRTLRAPPPGSVPRGLPPLRFGPGPEEARRAGETLRNPFDDAPATLERGRRVFQAFCAACHGPAGRGDGVVTTRGVPPPPSLASERIAGTKDGELFHVITFGRGNMPPHGGLVDRDDRWKVARYVRTLKEQP